MAYKTTENKIVKHTPIKITEYRTKGKKVSRTQINDGHPPTTQMDRWNGPMSRRIGPFQQRIGIIHSPRTTRASRGTVCLEHALKMDDTTMLIFLFVIVKVIDIR